MTKFFGIAAAALAFVSISSASAQTFVSTPGTYTFSGGSVQIQKGGGPVLTCSMSIDVTNVGGVLSAGNPTFTGSFGFCDTFIFMNSPWSVTVSGSDVTFHNIFISTQIPRGDCDGYLVASFSQSGPLEELYFDTGFSTPTTIPEFTISTGDCRMEGGISWP